MLRDKFDNEFKRDWPKNGLAESTLMWISDGRFNPVWDSKKAYDSIHRENPYNIMEKFGINNKLLTLIKMYMEGTKYQAIKMMQNAESGVAVNEHRVKICGQFEHPWDPPQDVLESIAFEKVEEFQYLGALLGTKNDWSQEISARIEKAERASFALSTFFKSKAPSKKTKLRLYTRTFENKIWRMICGSVRDARTNEWRRKFNKELQEELGLAPVTSYIKGQRLQWFGHIMRKNKEETIRAVIEWKPEMKRPRGRPRKRWYDIVEEDLKTMGVKE
ncbi:hypothetical protein QTP88_008370 [Uroleucon formosanum]